MKDIPAKTTDKYRQNPTRKIAWNLENQGRFRVKIKQINIYIKVISLNLIPEN